MSSHPARPLLALLASTMLFTSANAAEFDIVQGYKTAIQMNGVVEHGDAAKLQSVLDYRASLGLSTEYIMLNSLGGYIMDAALVADIIRANGIVTVVDVDGYCVSACVIEYAAGSSRLYWPGAHIGVHSATNETGAADGMSMQATMGMAHALSMLGVPAGIIGKMVSTPGSDVAWLDVNDVAGWANEAH